MKRAIVIYIENKRNLMLQFGCLYTSFKHIKSKDTELVVFGTREALDIIPNDCVKVECESVIDNPEWKGYYRLNSINCLNSKNSGILDRYDTILRSDVDTFITPAWNSFYPDMYMVGKGGYVNDDNTRSNLKRISEHFGLKHQGIHNMGSTHYGSSKLIREVCKLAMSTAHHLLNIEFVDHEGKWPGWYRGVTVMYSNDIAVNHLVDKTNLKIDGEKLDYYSTSEESVLNHPHIHCWHTDKIFSKFRFIDGIYDNLSMNDLDIGKVKDYCLYMALKSKKDMPWLGNKK